MRALVIALAFTACVQGEPIDDACAPVNCTSCELGFYGPLPRPTNAARLVIGGDDARATATVWFDDDALAVPSLPASLDIPPDALQISATTSHGNITVAFAAGSCP